MAINLCRSIPPTRNPTAGGAAIHRPSHPASRRQSPCQLAGRPAEVAIGSDRTGGPPAPALTALSGQSGVGWIVNNILTLDYTFNGIQYAAELEISADGNWLRGRYGSAATGESGIVVLQRIL